MNLQTVNSESQYLVYQDVSTPGNKTKNLAVRNKSSGVCLGHIRWYGPWRQYCFFPNQQTIFNQGCLADIQQVMYLLMVERAATRK